MAIGLIAPSFYIMQQFTSAAYQNGCRLLNTHLAVYKTGAFNFKALNLTNKRLLISVFVFKEISMKMVILP